MADDHDAAIAAFCEVTGCGDPTTAEHVLDAHGWALDAAVAFQLESGGGFGGGGVGAGAPRRPPPPRDDSPVVVSEEGSPPYVLVEGDEAAVRAAVAAAADGDEPIYLSDDDEEAAAHAAAVAVAQRQHRAAAAGGGGGHAGDDPPIDLPDGIDAEEARMLEAAMLGVPYGGRIPDWGAEAAARDARAASAAAAAADPASLASRALVQEQDAAYQASLAVDRVKEEERVAVAAAVAAEAAAAATAARAAAAAAAQAAEAGASRVAAAAACLPTEPEPGTPGALSVAVRLPDGTRLTRRFHPATDRVGHLFAWVVSSSPASPPPRAFRLVSSYPRRVLEEPEGMGGGLSLAEAGFAGGGSEALMVEAV